MTADREAVSIAPAGRGKRRSLAEHHPRARRAARWVGEGAKVVRDEID
jgi:hypothetical protein